MNFQTISPAWRTTNMSMVFGIQSLVITIFSIPIISSSRRAGSQALEGLMSALPILSYAIETEGINCSSKEEAYIVAMGHLKGGCHPTSHIVCANFECQIRHCRLQQWGNLSSGRWPGDVCGPRSPRHDVCRLDRGSWYKYGSWEDEIHENGDRGGSFWKITRRSCCFHSYSHKAVVVFV